MLKHLWQFYWHAQTRYRIHSPFVYELLNEVIEDNSEYYVFDALALLRAQLAKNQQAIEVLDLGAGSRKKGGDYRRVNQILKHAVSPDWQCRFLFRLVNYLQAERRLEIGTSLGISTLYQYFPNTKEKLITLEGSPAIAAIARSNFERMGARNIQLLEGNFEDTLPKALKQLGRLDFLYLDGNHRKKPSLAYFEACIPYLHDRSVILVDDIYWSEEMAAAWRAIKAHPEVRLTIDLCWAGLVFFRPEQKEVEHFRLIPYKYKPWQLGIFK